MTRFAVNNCFHTLYIGFPGPVGSSVRVGYLDAESDTFSTDIAFSHGLHLLHRATEKLTLIYYHLFPMKARVFYKKNNNYCLKMK